MADHSSISNGGQSWFCTTGLPSDIVIEIDSMTFHLHKFPLMSRSRTIHDLITKHEEEEQDEEEDCYISFPEFPGGAEVFELAVKFCYGMKIELSSSNVGPLRCAGEILGMTDEYSDGNLISKTELFISQMLMNSIKDSIRALQSCQTLTPLSETLGIIQKFIDSIADKASPHEDSSQLERKILSRRKSEEEWINDLANLTLPIFNRLIFAMKTRDLKTDVIENCVIHYARLNIPGITRGNRKSLSSSPTISQSEQREILESVIANLPIENTIKSSTTTRILFGLLRAAIILNSSETCRVTIERKIGSQLEQASLDDLLIPSYSYLNETLYDVYCVERILGCFLDELMEERQTEAVANVMLVGKLLDGYLSEIASDANLKPEKFYQLAVSLPEQARVFDDGLYRAIDVYFKAHPWLSEAEREKICEVMDCEKLTLEACNHAAQNERLPVRVIVQVLFFEQLQLRQVISVGTPDGSGGGGGVGRRWRSPAIVQENQVDMNSMRTRVHELERECSTMKKVIQNMGPSNNNNNNNNTSGGGGGKQGLLAKKFGCKFKPQVCDSHLSIVGAHRPRNHQQPHHHHHP
ncbi:BTB/POZ domain-containing protein At5g66560-like [Impatiens glandulifera]|uniref:BTB/POZ domain-containing protein At5g66560-like n=1 Tax=Impatiens glandulifera TaxID=253017 RepID=UPI001FB10689|nr:BTB/POZ domain-containing protein At5g66560-like [Impatiens glandulifera]